MNFLINVAHLWRQTNRVPRRKKERQNTRSITLPRVDQTNRTASRRQIDVNARANFIRFYIFIVFCLDLWYPTLLYPLPSSSDTAQSLGDGDGVGRAERSLMHIHKVRAEASLEVQVVSSVWHQNLFGMPKNCDLNSCLV
jgi:hypothetical protein